MNYPLISEYVEAIKSAEDNFNQLKNLRPVLDDAGNPIMTSGNFAVVFKMEDSTTGKMYAVKCFIKEQEGRSEAYRLISEELKDVESDYLTSFRYLPDELFVDSFCNEQNKLYDDYLPLVEFAKKHVKMSVDDRRNPTQCQFTDNYGDITIVMLSRDMSVQEIVEHKHALCVARTRIGGFYVLCDSDDVAMDGKEFPVLVMDWVEGVTLDRYIRDDIDDIHILETLTYRFSLLAEWLLSQPFAHGDLKPENIIVQPGCWLTLVDYDGMYVPAMKGQKAREIGSPDFRHPSRNEDCFNEHIDEFPIVSIILSLKAISLHPAFLSKYGAPDRLLFSASDYVSITNSPFVNDNYPGEDMVFNMLVLLFFLALDQPIIDSRHLKLIKLPLPEHLRDEQYGLITFLGKTWQDETGTLYSKDGLVLVKASNVVDFRCRPGVKVIGFGAFAGKDSIETIELPNSITAIAQGAFCGCQSLKRILLPNSLDYISEGAFSECKVRIECLSDSYFVDDDLLYDHRGDFISLIFCPTDKESVIIPSYVMLIGKEAFRGCYGLASVTIPDSIRSIGDRSFSGCSHLTCVHIPNSVRELSPSTFHGCSHLTTVELSDSIRIIGAACFKDCVDLETINFPTSLNQIGSCAFEHCKSLRTITIPSSVKTIGYHAFADCYKLQYVEIPSLFFDRIDFIFGGQIKDLVFI